ncbi:MAG TPA: gamma-glutamyl-gamma-aminobutyrate hydrolase family protein [Propionibacteriaceae bacterium]|jgi:putative glutamine amidotransferase|nr:gamma-glutamyl-gamma-aminobutyrate hydrolase family protein [Propionibacteriaceae bacterium]
MGDRSPDARPLVIIPARFSQDASALRYEAEVAAAKLLAAVWEAGGEPLVVHPTTLGEPHLKRLQQRFWMADAILLPGGGDLSPRWYGEQPHPTLYNVDETQDAFDLALARWAIADRIPLLAICRGNQVVNVALGGTLVQDMTEEIGRNHRNFVHDIELDAESPLRQVVADDQITISCSHHQCIAVLGDRLVAAAHAADNTIEAVTLADHEGWYLGVQWHLEDLADTDPIQHGIFRAFVGAATSNSYGHLRPS